MTKDITEFVDNYYFDYESIIKEELFFNSNPPNGFYESFILNSIPALKKIKEKEEFYPIVKVQLLNFYKEDELPSKEKIKILSNKIFHHYTEINKDEQSERLNKIHSTIGITLIIINVMIFIILEIMYGNKQYSIGIISLIFGIIIWFSPCISGYFAYRKKKFSYFGMVHYLWMIFNIVLIFILIGTFLSYL